MVYEIADRYDGTSFTVPVIFNAAEGHDRPNANRAADHELDAIISALEDGWLNNLSE